MGQSDNSTEATNLIMTVKPGVVIADIFLPEPDGLEVSRYAHRQLPDIKVVLISAHEERIYEELAREEGAIAFIPGSRLSLQTLLQAL